MIGTYPAFMTYTNGLAGDSPQLTPHITALLKMKAEIDEYRLDGSYDSFLNRADYRPQELQISDLKHHAAIWYMLRTPYDSSLDVIEAC